jgi:hypothetical protein
VLLLGAPVGTPVGRQRNAAFGMCEMMITVYLGDQYRIVACISTLHTYGHGRLDFFPNQALLLARRLALRLGLRRRLVHRGEPVLAGLHRRRGSILPAPCSAAREA